MKKYLIALAITPATFAHSNAAIKCVNLQIEAGRCTLLNNSGADWSASCAAQEIRGVAICSSNAGKDGATLQNLTISTLNNYCWCKLTYPVLSDWVIAKGSSISDCSMTCARQCTLALSSEPFVNSLYKFNSSLL